MLSIYGRHWVQEQPFGQLYTHCHCNTGHEQVNSKHPAASICRKQMEIEFPLSTERKGKCDFFITIDFKPSEFISLQKSDLCQVCLCLDSVVRVRKEPTSLVQCYRGYGAMLIQELEDLHLQNYENG